MTNLKFWLVNAKGRRRVLAFTLGLASLMVLGFMVYSQREVLQNYSWHVNWLPLTGAALVFMIDLLLVASTWADIMESLGSSLPYSTHLRYYCLANVGKRLPGTIWYVAGRGLLYAHDGVRVGIVSVGSGVEFLVALLSGIAVSILFGFPLLANNIAAAGGLVVIFGVLLIVHHGGGLRMLLQRVGVDAPDCIRLSRFWGWLVVYACAWMLGGIMLYLFANTVVDIGIEQIGHFVGIWSAAGVLSYSLFFLPLNLGVTAVTISLMLSKFMPSPLAAIVTVLLWVAVTVFELISAVACLWLIQITSKGRASPS